MEDTGPSAQVADNSQAEKPSLLARFLALDGLAAQFRSLLVNALIIFMLMMSLPILWREITSDSVTIQPISVPDKLTGQGLTGSVVAERLWDSWLRLNHEAAIAKETREVLPRSQRIEFSIPDSGLSFDSFMYHLRGFFGLSQTIVSGEMVCNDDACSTERMALRLRVIDNAVHVIELPERGSMDEGQYFRRAMAEVLLKADPVRGVMALRLENQALEGTDERAVAELLKLVRSNHPERDWAEAYAGSLLQTLGDDKAAMKHFDAVISRNPGFVFALRLKAAAQLATGDAAAALATAQRALTQAPGNALLLLIEAKTLAQLGRLDDAMRAFDAAEKTEPNNLFIPLQRGQILASANKLDAGMAEFAKVIAIDPEHREARELLALGASLRKDDAEAVRQQKVVVRVTPDDATALATLASYQQRAGQAEEASASMEKALGLRPPSAGLLRQQADLLRAQGKALAAIPVLERALVLEPSMARLHLDLGDCQLDLRRFDEAKASYERFIALAPEDDLAMIAKLKIELAQKMK